MQYYQSLTESYPAEIEIVYPAQIELFRNNIKNKSNSYAMSFLDLFFSLSEIEFKIINSLKSYNKGWKAKIILKNAKAHLGDFQAKGYEIFYHL